MQVEVLNSLVALPYPLFPFLLFLLLLQPLNESGYSTVKFGAPDILLRCSTKENVKNHSCFFKIINDDANLNGADIVWKIPSGRKAHTELVSVFTFISALLSTLLIVCTSLRYSNIRLGKTIKQV